MLQKQRYVVQMADNFKIYARSEVGIHSENLIVVRRVTGNFQLRMDRDMHKMQFESHLKFKLFQCKPLCSFVHWMFYLNVSYSLNMTFMELYYTSTLMPCKNGGLLISGDDHQMGSTTEEMLRQKINIITEGQKYLLCSFLFLKKKYNDFYMRGYYSMLSIVPDARNIMIGLYAKSEAYFYLNTMYSVLDRGL